MYTHAYTTHTYAHTGIHTHAYTTHTYAHIRTHTHAYTTTHMYTHTYAHIHMNSYTRIHHTHITISKKGIKHKRNEQGGGGRKMVSPAIC